MQVLRAGPSSAAHTGRLTNLMATDADRIGKAESITWLLSQAAIVSVAIVSIAIVSRQGRERHVATLLSQWTFSVLTLPLIIYMMARELGPSAYVGVAAFLGSSLLSTLLSYAAMPFNRRMQECRDARGALLCDAVKGVGVLKAYGCEAAWGRRVSASRRAELAQLRAVRYLGAGTSLVCGVLAQGTPFAIFSWFVLVQHEHLDASTAFVALAWIQQLQWSINALPGLVYAWAFLAPSLRRLCAVIDIDIDSDAPRPAAPPAGGHGQHGQHGQQGRHGRQGRRAAPPPINAAPVPATATEDEEEPPLAPLLAHHLPRGVVVALRGARLMPSVSSSAADGDSGDGSGGDGPALCLLPSNGGTRYNEVTPRYREVELQVEAAELLILCGAVGSGKSTLLAALAGARPLAAGTRAATRRRAYVAQQPFLMRESVRRNVLFGQPFEAARYERALAMAALEPDLRAMPRGDETDVGEGGHALSGGQRARVAFARAVYAEAEALFLDDIFAAVDAQVGRRLWASVARLVGEGRTVVLVTHQLQLLHRPQVSRVALLRRGNLVACSACDAAMRERVRAAISEDVGTQVRSGGGAAVVATAAAVVGDVNVGEATEADSVAVGPAAEGGTTQGQDAADGSDGGDDSKNGDGGEGGEGGEGGVAALVSGGLSHAACVRLLRSSLSKLEGRYATLRQIEADRSR